MKQTPKCLNAGGPITMKAQMAFASKPHSHFQGNGKKSILSEKMENTYEKAMGGHNMKEDRIETQGR